MESVAGMLSYCPALQSVVSTHTRSEDAVEPVYSNVKPTEHVETGMQVSPVPYSPSTHSHLAVWSDPLMSTAVQIARWSQGGTHSKGTHHRSEEEVGAAASYSVSAHSVKIAHTAKVVAAVDCKVVTVATALAVIVVSLLCISNEELVDPNENLPAGQSAHTRSVWFVHGTISSCTGAHGGTQVSHELFPCIEKNPGWHSWQTVSRSTVQFPSCS